MISCIERWGVHYIRGRPPKAFVEEGESTRTHWLGLRCACPVFLSRWTQETQEALAEQPLQKQNSLVDILDVKL